MPAKVAPWVKFFSSDFLNGVSDLAADEIGIYTVLLALQWDKGSPIADDSAWLARRCGTSTRRFNQVRARLIEIGKLEARNGLLGNRRAIAAVEERDRKSHQSRSAALARWHGHQEPELDLGQTPEKDEIKTGKTPEQNSFKSGKSEHKAQKTANGTMQTHDSLSRARATPEDSEAREESNPTTSDSITASLDAVALTDHLTRIAGVRNIDPARIITNVQIVREWLDLGVDVVDIERAITAARDQASGPLHSLKYFDPPIRKAQARKVHPHARSDHHPSEIADPLLRRYLERGGTLDA